MRRVLLLLALATSVTLPSSAHAAGTYTQPNWFTWNTASLDVIIVPPEHGQVFNGNGVLGGSEGGTSEVTPFNSYLRAIEDSIVEWQNGVTRYGSATLRAGLQIRKYVVGRDTIPTSALQNPEIVITTDQTKAVILGVSVSSRPCLISDSKFFVQSYTYKDMRNIGGHEFGHCLGLDHTFGSPDDSVVTRDIIYATYSQPVGSASNVLQCVSNLNVMGLERSFAIPLGLSPVGGSATIASTSYVRPASC